MLDKEEDLFLVSCRFKFIKDVSSWIFRGVYGPTNYGSKESLWEELGAIRGLWGDLWCIGGDFNVVRFPNERNNGIYEAFFLGY